MPNSNFVTGVVKNWVHNDRIGRIIVAINVAYESDVEAVRDILIAAAKAQDLVLEIPAPTVLFAEFGDWALKFNLVCFVDDVELGERTRATSISTSCAGCARPASASPTRRSPPDPDAE